MNIKLHPYQLQFLFPFRIAHGVRTHTDALFIELEMDGITAYGEATFPPYLPYTREDAVAKLSSVSPDKLINFSGVINPSRLKPLYPYLPPPALAALDMAVWSLKSKQENTNIAALLGITEGHDSLRSYTISVCDRSEMAIRIAHGTRNGFTFFKLKMNGHSDAQMLADFRSLTDSHFGVDANQAWTDIAYAKAFSKELEKQGCVLIEQPFHKSDLNNTRILAENLSIPVIADESCQTIEDIDKVKDYVSGINVKLQKCGGITPAFEMIKRAKSLGLKVLIGCMSESIIGCAAGEVLAPLCDWNDLDGSYLVKEVPFRN